MKKFFYFLLWSFFVAVISLGVFGKLIDTPSFIMLILATFYAHIIYKAYNDDDDDYDDYEEKFCRFLPWMIIFLTVASICILCGLIDIPDFILLTLGTFYAHIICKACNDNDDYKKKFCCFLPWIVFLAVGSICIFGGLMDTRQFILLSLGALAAYLFYKTFKDDDDDR